MIPRILVYLENGPLHFGTAKYIKENLSCELFGIINTNKGRKFYKKQNLVKFTKFWLLQDHVKNVIKSPDINYLQEFENKYKIDLWKAIFSDAIFLHYNKFHKFSHDEILANIEQLCKLYESILDQINPNFLVIRLTDAIADNLLHLMCKARQINVSMLSQTRFGYRSFISNRPGILDQEAFLNFNEKKLSDKELIQLVKGYGKQQVVIKNKFRNSFLSWLRASFHFFGVMSDKDYQNYYPHTGRNIPKTIWNELMFKIQKKQRQNFLNNNAIKNVNFEKKYIYFALGLEPEGPTLISTPFYTNQIEVIRSMAKSIPVDYQLYVKEHPMQTLSAWRNIEYYREILELPNVKLIHPSVNNEKLLKNCSLAVTVVGTPALEAAIYKKPSIVYGEVIFSMLPSVHKVKNIEDLPSLVRKAINTQVNSNDLNKFVNIVLDNSFAYDENIINMDILHQLFYDGYVFDIDIKIEDMEKILKNAEESIEIIGSQHLERIKKHSKKSVS